MSDQGVFQVHRGIFDHPMFAPEPFTEREAWLWMLSAAAWVDKRVRVGKAMIDLKRGQLAFALRFLATKFQWTDSKVRRFLKKLKGDAMIVVSATREATQVTICNYDTYQFGRRTDDAQSDAPTDALATHERRKEEELKHSRIKKEEEKKDTREVALSFFDPPDFDEFWAYWPNKVGKPAAMRAYSSAIKRGAKPSEIVDGVRNYIRDKPPDRPWLNPATFLNQNRWEDRPAPIAKPLSAYQAERETGREILDALSDASSRQDSKVLRQASGAGPEDVHGGSGGNLIELSARRIGTSG